MRSNCAVCAQCTLFFCVRMLRAAMHAQYTCSSFPACTAAPALSPGCCCCPTQTHLLQDDSVGGDSWRYMHESNKGKHQLVRDLLLLTACNPAAADATMSTPRPALSQQPAAAAATPAANGDSDAIMQDAGTPAAANEPAPCEPTAAVQATAAGVVPDQVPLVSALELVQSARVLLLLLLQLYSSCEEAGVYGRAGEGRHHMQRLQGGSGQPNDR